GTREVGTREVGTREVGTREAGTRLNGPFHGQAKLDRGRCVFIALDLGNDLRLTSPPVLDFDFHLYALANSPKIRFLSIGLPASAGAGCWCLCRGAGGIRAA